ncbi:DUF11 domain-containing protein [Pirellulales bacterium]|nr:DUF11 domain-containing protein [Pirellulales bacterium]
MHTILKNIFSRAAQQPLNSRTLALSKRQRPLFAEQLEARRLLAADATVNLIGASQSLLGEDVNFVVTFDNTSTDPTDNIGYSPFVDIVMPLTGDAPPLPNNGISFPSGSIASYNGLNLSTTEVIFDANGEAIHPFAKDSAGQPVIISGKPGDQLIVVELPFGSYGPTQPPIDINFTGSISPDAQPNHAYDVTATGGYRYQVDAVGNPTDDNAAFGTTIVDPVQPQLFRLKKTSNTPEHETATGPNFQHSYTISMAVAPGQTVDNLELTDTLPDEVQYVSVVTISGNSSTTQTQTSAPSTTSPGGTLSYAFDQVIGTGSDNDVQLVFDYYVAQQDANGQDVIPLGTGGTKTITNNSSATGLWTSSNPNFPTQQTVSSNASDPNSQYALTARTVALQKGFTNLTNPGSPKAGDTIEYRLNIQVSDFFALDAAVLEDVLSDGQEFDASFTPTLTFRQQAGNNNYANEPFDPANVSTTLNPLGTQTVSFDISEQLKALRGPTAPGSILGASIPLSGTGGSVPPTNPGGPGTTGTIVFQAKVLNDYRQTPSPGADVVEGDVMTDNADIAATVLNYSDLTPTSSVVTNGSQKSFTLANGGSDKTLFAINGTTPTPNQRVVPGDEVTFRLEYTLPFSSIKDYEIVDYLPLPIFDPTGDLVWNGQPPSSAAPQAGQWSFGPTDTFSQAPINGPNPGNATLKANANSLTWDFGTFADPIDRSGKTDILFTVTATNKPFGDGLLLTNQGQQSEVNQQGTVITSSPGIAQITVAEPELTITKGVVSTDNSNGQFTQNTLTGTTPPLPAGVTFTQPGLSGASFSGTVTSGPPDGLATTPIDATLANVAGNDLVKFAIIVENTGSSPNGAFDVTISDTYDTSKFQIPTSTGLNLQVTDGAGTTLGYTGTDTDLFSAAGIELVDPGATSGSLKPGSSQLNGTVINNGENIAVITYDLQILPTVAPLDVIPNTGTIKNYASTEGGPNFANGLTDDTDVTIQGPEIAKSLVGTSIIDAFNSNTQAVIGEIATFKLEVIIPRGTTPDAIVVDSLPAGLAFQQMVGTPSIDTGVSFTGSLTPVLSNDGKTVTFNLGDVTNTNVSDDLKGFTVEYEAVVLNVRSNQQNTKLTNNAKLDWLNHPELPAVTSSAVTVIEPTITVNKTVNPSTAQAGDTATFTIDISAGTTTAYDVVLKDIFPANITPVANSLRAVSGVTPNSLVSSAGGNAFEAAWNTLTPGQTSRLSFEVTVDANVISGTSITNSANATWTSLGNPAQITTNNPDAFQRTGTGSTTQGQLNDYKTSNSATLNVANPIVTKTLVSTSIVNANNSNTQAVIGEKAIYEIVVTIPQGRTPAARLIDTMRHKQLAYVSSTTPVVSDPASVTVPGLTNTPTFSGNANHNIVTWDFGDIVNTDTDSTKPETLTFQIETLVLNVNYSHQGVRVRNDAQLRWSNNSRSNNAKNQDVQIIEPKLTTTKSVIVGGLGGNPGDPVTYTIEIQQDGSSATDAFDTTLRDIIPSTIASPTLTSVADTAGVVTTNNFQITGNTLTTVTAFDVEKDPAGRTITLTIDGTLQGPFTANQSITNTNTIEWTSLAGDPGPITPNPSNTPFNYERTGSNSTTLGQLNNYKTNDAATFTVNTADLRVSKTVSDPTPNVGDTITFTVTVTNNGPNVATGIELTDTFPTSGLLLDTAGIAPSQGSYDPGTGIWTIGTLQPNASVTLDLPATVLIPAAGTIPSPQTNTAEITAVVEPDPTPGNNKATATETPKYADLEVIKQTSDPTPNDGDTVTYTITLTNNGKDTATNIELTDTLPSPVTYQSVVTITPGTNFNPTGTPTTGGIWSVPSIDPGDVFTLEFQVIANAGNLSYNTISITQTDTYDPILSNNSSRTPTDPQDADLAVDKIVNNSTPQVGDNVVFTVTVTNNGPNTAKDVEVDDLLPTGLTHELSKPSVGTYVPGTGVWDVGDMALNEVQTLVITAKVEAPTSSTGPGAVFTNTATGDTSTTDPNPGNETDSAFVIPLQSDLAIAKAVSDATPNVGDTIQFAIGATNYGPADATGVVVTDVIPVGLTYVGPTAGIGTNPTVGSINEVGGTLTWIIGPLNAGSTTAGALPLFIYDVTVDAPSPDGIPPTLANSANITGTEHDPNLINNNASVSETPQYADLEVDKQVSNTTPNIGDVITYTVTVTNSGKDNAENVELTDTLPTLTGLSIVGTPVTSAGTFDTGTGIWDIGTVYVGSPATLLVQAEVLVPVTGNPLPQTNTATITAVTQYDPDPTNDFDTATETPQYADLRVVKNVNDPAPNVGDNIFFGITVENLGANQATNVTIDDVLPAGLSFVSASSTDYDPGTGVWNVGTVDVGTSNTKTLQITATVAASGSFTNEAEISGTNPPDQFDPDLTNNKGSATVVTREADLLVNKSVNDAAPNVGDIITFTIDVTNNGPDVANNVEITDQLPTAGLAFLSSTETQGSYDSGTGIWTVGTIDVGVLNTQTLTIDARVLAPARTTAFTIPPAQTNVAEVTNVDEHDPHPLNNRSEVTETPKYADLQVEKITTNVQPNVGDTFIYTVTLKNNGVDTATNVEVTELFPNNISVISVTPTNTHTTTRFNQTATGGIWSVPTIAPADFEVLTILAEATSASVAYNVVTINHSDVWDPNLDNNQARTPTDPQQADLVVTKTVDTPRPEVNDSVTFTITVENLGPTSAQNVTVADPLPTGLSFVSAVPPADYDETNGIWTVGTLADPSLPPNTRTLTITAKVLEPASGSGLVSQSINTATAASTTVDPNPGNNSGTATVNPLQADLVITKTASNLKPQIGSTFNYTIEVSNRGPDTASNVVVNDLLQAGVQYQSDTGVGAYVPGTGVWTIGPMNTGDRQTLTITALVTIGNSGGAIPNTATVGSGTWDPDLLNNTATITVVVPPRGVIVGTDIGCVTGPFVRVIDPDTGADRITPFFAYEPDFRGGARVYGADVTGDGEPDIITAPGPGRPGEVKVWEIKNGTAVENTEYSFFPFGPSYTGGVEISEGSITAVGAVEIVAAQNFGGLVSVFEVTPGTTSPVNTTPVRQIRPFGTNYFGGVTIDTADVGTVNGSTVTSQTPDGITELFVGSGFGIQAQVKGYNGTTASPTLFNSFNVMSAGYSRGVSVARLPSSTTGSADRILVSSGIDGNAQVETYNGATSSRDAVFQAYGNGQTQVFSAAIDDDALFNVQGVLGTTDGVQKSDSTSGAGKSTLQQSTASYPPLRVAILRN